MCRLERGAGRGIIGHGEPVVLIFIDRGAPIRRNESCAHDIARAVVNIVIATPLRLRGRSILMAAARPG